MTDKQLADAVRLAGWLRDDGVITAPWGSWTPGLHKHTWQDWQLWVLAGALLEKNYIRGDMTQCVQAAYDYIPEHGSVARSIIEACVEALGKRA